MPGSEPVFYLAGVHNHQGRTAVPGLTVSGGGQAPRSRCGSPRSTKCATAGRSHDQALGSSPWNAQNRSVSAHQRMVQVSPARWRLSMIFTGVLDPGGGAALFHNCSYGYLPHTIQSLASAVVADHCAPGAGTTPVRRFLITIDVSGLARILAVEPLGQPHPAVGAARGDH